MAKQDAIQDKNQFPALLGHTGTAGTADTVRITATGGKLDVSTEGAAIPRQYDTISVTYPDGTTDQYVYKLGTAIVGTIAVTYTDSTKGSLSAVAYTS